MVRALFLALLCSAAISLATAANDPDVGKTIVALVQSRGYPIEQHFVQTEDGYILGVFRIPHGRSGPGAATNGTKPVVFLQHGLLDSAFTWVNNFEKQSLAYILADAGYDVWMGNSRGNTWSRNHVSYSVDSKAFWEFSWDDMAQFDLPAAVNYVLDKSGAATLSYVGHSQGTIQAFAAFTSNSDLARKVNYFAALAPVAYVNHQKVLLLNLLADIHLGDILSFLGEKQFLPSVDFLEKLDAGICKAVPWGCADILFLLCGKSNYLNETRIPVYVSQTPAGTSVRNMIHWTQGVLGDKFQKYDYGCGIFSCANKAKYGQRTPPLYPLSNMQVPTGVYWGGEDSLADPVDVQRLLNELPSNMVANKMYIPDYAHLDFVWATNAHESLYPEVLKQIQIHSQAAALRAKLHAGLRGSAVAA